MPENRFFLDQPFEQGTRVQLSPEECHHLKVMRKKAEDIIELVNGRGQLAVAQYEGSKQALLQEVLTDNKPQRKVILAQAYLRPKNLDFVIEKGTELGATAFWLFPGQKSEKKSLSKAQFERCRHLIISALKQSGRLHLPEIELLPPIIEWKDFPIPLYYGDLKTETVYKSPSSDVILVVGPERGLSEEELQFLGLRGQGVRIHPNILRAETAALCFLALSSKKSKN